MRKRITLALAAALMLTLTACGGGEEQSTPTLEVPTPAASNVQTSGVQPSEAPQEDTEVEQLYARFGGGEAYPLELEENQTAKDIARHVGTADWNLPIYHYDDFEDSDVMQYYDIPSRYEITNLSETVTEEKAGEVYYSEPNRIILFYADAAVEGEYTLVGRFDATEEFVDAVVNNPVVEGWGNKLISISASE